MARLRILLPLLLLLLSAPASAVEIYWSPSSPELDPGAVNLRRLPSGWLVLAPDGREASQDKDLQPIPVPEGTIPFLVKWHDPEKDLARVGAEFTVLRKLDEGYGIIAVPDGQQQKLDGLGLHRERLLYLAPNHLDLETPRPAARKATDPQTKADLVNGVDEAVIAQYMRELSGDLPFWLDGVLQTTDNRYTHNPEHLIAADYIQDRLEAMGYTVTRQYFQVGATTTQNIIAQKVGTLYPDEIVVVGAHYDSISESPQYLAPGCEDNGSGTAGVLHLAQLFADYDVERTIHFVAFGGEEQGLYGSQYYVQQAGLNGADITQSLIMDMIGSWQSNYKVIIEGDEPWASLMELYESNVVTWAGIGYRKDWYSWGSDHVPFQQAGVPCFLAIDWDYGIYPGYHRIADVFSATDPTLARDILRAMAATLVDLTSPTPSATPAQRPQSRRSVHLAQNHPNPFNPTTTIAFELDADGPVRVDVFDTSGRHIRNLADAAYTAGRHELSWSGEDAQGRSVASGVYLYRLQSGDTVLTQRMVLAK